MPDILSHILFALILTKLFNIKRKTLVVLGAVLPDILGKLKMINYLTPGAPPGIVDFSNLFHSPIPLFVSAFIVALFFEYPYLGSVFFIFLGNLSHLLLDGTTKSFLFNGYLPILWADQFYIWIIVLSITYCLLTVLDIQLIKDQQTG